MQPPTQPSVQSFTIPLHSIIITIGPSGCGKTTFCQRVLIPKLTQKDARLKVAYVSSDEIRKSLLPAGEYTKLDSSMLDVSEQAFNLLYAQVNALSSFPVKSEFIVVDSTALGDVFRTKILEIAERNHYGVVAFVFNYKSIDTYFRYAISDHHRRVISDQHRRFKENVIREIKTSVYSKVYRLSEHIVDANIDTPQCKEYFACFLNPNFRYVIIGDLHESLDELIALLEKYKITLTPEGYLHVPEGIKVILVGDLIDKGSRLRDTIDFVHRNLDRMILIRGNHDEFNYRHRNSTEEIRNPHFSSLPIIRTDADLRKKFETIYEQMIPFAWCRGITRSSFVVTHGPCQMKHLGKMDPKGLKYQLIGDMTLDQYDRNNPKVHPEFLKHLSEQTLKKGDTSSVYHVFGHVAFSRVYCNGRNIGVDTGSIGGNRLTAVTIEKNQFFTKHQPFLNKQPVREERIVQLPTSRPIEDVDLNELQKEEISRLNFVIRNSINYISGTMCPADKKDDCLESLEEGLAYFRRNSIDEVVLEPKYMGSRCTVYLNRDLNSCYATSRNGYRIRNLKLLPVYEQLMTKLGPYMKEQQISQMILDGELLPWRALGSGLIDHDFNSIGLAAEIELKMLQESGFEAELAKVRTSQRYLQFRKDTTNTKKDIIKKTYGPRDFGSFSQLQSIDKLLIPLKDQQAGLEIYQKQVALHGAHSELVYKPFNVLKISYLDNTEILPESIGWKTSDLFRLGNSDEICCLKLSDPNCLSLATTYFDSLVAKGLEGIVIKPEVIKPHVAPYMKVRNEKYLTIIYGYTYQHPSRYGSLIEGKSIKKKLTTSIAEYQLGQEMLSYKMPLQEEDLPRYRQLVANILFENRKEKEIDPRL